MGIISNLFRLLYKSKGFFLRKQFPADVQTENISNSSSTSSSSPSSSPSSSSSSTCVDSHIDIIYVTNLNPVSPKKNNSWSKVKQFPKSMFSKKDKSSNDHKASSIKPGSIMAQIRSLKSKTKFGKFKTKYHDDIDQMIKLQHENNVLRFEDESKLDTTQHAFNKLKNQYTESKEMFEKKIEQLQQSLSQCQHEVGQLREENENLSKRRETIKITRSGTISKLQKTIADLRDQLDEEKAKSEYYLNCLVEQRAQAEVDNEEINRIKKKMEETEASLKRSNARLRTSSRTISTRQN
ncbi:uncharacterized protein SPAPADRAFT_67470 [Spathaspora passalidarum NRRL Y-27907]|uniref:Uncharacterized protein n=1 Tax=Spathaspora passalidarum (strain NRRL Y-27907 / 11-Y1) TaxID=619300 RepID=G3AQ56_SPAPN|nr:uncharacterized protein SPAPADRAFT_67470 [Spathaspora passalidarum NRRL Y-27907]EGW31403.1 hypothetical protein SPAPADRAFT_67470 [Spathaspora passalidarum NRRL Y-27907]